MEVLPEATLGDNEDVRALFLRGPHMPQRVRAFLDFMTPPLPAFLQG